MIPTLAMVGQTAQSTVDEHADPRPRLRAGRRLGSPAGMVCCLDSLTTGMFSLVSAWLTEALRTFGQKCVDELAGPGDREAAIRAPGSAGLRAVSIDGAIGGYVEVKAPGKGIDPASFTGHDRRQWDRQHDLPNLLYTNGTQWRLFRDGAALGSPVGLRGGDLATAGPALCASDDGFETLLAEFLKWRPAAVTSVSALVRAVAPLTRLLRRGVGPAGAGAASRRDGGGG